MMHAVGPDQPAAKGVARRRREQARRSLGKKVGWLTNLLQSSAAHHTTKRQNVDSSRVNGDQPGREDLESRVAALSEELALLKNFVENLLTEEYLYIDKTPVDGKQVVEAHAHPPRGETQQDVKMEDADYAQTTYREVAEVTAVQTSGPERENVVAEVEMPVAASSKVYLYEVKAVVGQNIRARPAHNAEVTRVMARDEIFQGMPAADGWVEHIEGGYVASISEKGNVRLLRQAGTPWPETSETPEDEAEPHRGRRARPAKGAQWSTSSWTSSSWRW